MWGSWQISMRIRARVSIGLSEDSCDGLYLPPRASVNAARRDLEPPVEPASVNATDPRDAVKTALFEIAGACRLDLTT